MGGSRLVNGMECLQPRMSQACRTPQKTSRQQKSTLWWDPALCVQEEELRIGKDTPSQGKEEADGQPM